MTDLSKQTQTENPYKEAAETVFQCFLEPIESQFDAFAVESFFGTETVTKQGKKAPLMSLLSAKVPVCFTAFFLIFMSFLAGFALTLLSIGLAVNDVDVPPWMIILSTLFVLYVVDMRERRKRLRATIANKLFDRRDSLESLSKLICEHQVYLRNNEADIDALQKTAVDLAVRARPSDVEVTSLARKMLELYRVCVVPNHTKELFEAHYCQGKSNA